MRRCASRRRCSGVCTPAAASSSTCPRMPCWRRAPTACWAGSSPARSRPGNTRDDYDQQGPASFFACADGFVYLYMTSGSHWAGLKTLMGQPEWLDEFEDDWLEFSVTPEKVAEFQQRIRRLGPRLAQRRGIGRGPAARCSAGARQERCRSARLTPVPPPRLLPRRHSSGTGRRGVSHGVPYALSASPARIITRRTRSR